MSDNPIRTGVEYAVKVTAEIEGTVEGTMFFSDEDVREWAGLSEHDELDDDTVEEYAQEMLDEGAMDITDISYWKSSDAEIVTKTPKRIVPKYFVPLF